jgi:hypothetical protein
MAIIGKINVQNYYFTLKGVTVGSCVYMSPEYVTATKKGIFIPADSAVAYEEDLKKKEMYGLVKIRRTGSGLTEKDFEVDFSGCLYYPLFFEPNSVHNNLIGDSDMIFFKYSGKQKRKIFKTDDKKVYVKYLRKQMQNAASREDHFQATRIRDEIKKISKKKKQK